MALSALATEAKAITLIATCRAALAVGGSVRGQDLVEIINQLQLATTADLSARANITPDSKVDGRNAADATTAGG